MWDMWAKLTGSKKDKYDEIRSGDAKSATEGANARGNAATTATSSKPSDQQNSESDKVKPKSYSYGTLGK